MHRIPFEKPTVFKKKSQHTCNRLRAVKLCATYPPVMYGVFDNSGNHSLNGQHFKTHWTDTITSPTKYGPLAQNRFWYFPNFVCHFLFYFLRIEILESTTTKLLWTYLHLNVKNKFSFMNMLVQLLCSLRQRFLTFFCAMEPFDSLVKTTDPFSQ